MAKGNDGLMAVLGSLALAGLGAGLAVSLLSPKKPARRQRPARTKLFDDQMPGLQRRFLNALTNRRGDEPFVNAYENAEARRDIEGYLVRTTARVHREVRYMPDERTSGLKDFWQSPYETLSSGMGDCEDHAILIYRRLKEAGYQVVDLVVGLSGLTGHAWVEVTANDQRYVLEGTNGAVYRGRTDDYTPGVWMTMSGYRKEEFGAETPVTRQNGWYS